MQPTERRILFILILIAGLAWISLSTDKSGTAAQTGISAPQAGFIAPDFTLKTTDQRSVTLSDLRGQAVLINIWTTWCPPCRAEMPAIEKIYQEYKDQGLIVLGLNSTHQDDPANIGPFIKEYSLSFPILIDDTGSATTAYQVKSLPTSVFVNRDSTINQVVVGGPMSEALLRTRVEGILK
jgi:cytochrome c biogenesis protein CcmG, thiol:disulfide interchange protein DsbE